MCFWRMCKKNDFAPPLPVVTLNQQYEDVDWRTPQVIRRRTDIPGDRKCWHCEEVLIQSTDYCGICGRSLNRPKLKMR